MRRSLIHLALAAVLVSGAAMHSCKNKNKDSTNNTTVNNDSLNRGPVEISPDETLRNGLTDATKDFPGVTATVNNGEVTLTGKIKRDRLPTLMQSVNALNPKKVNNNLTIEP